MKAVEESRADLSLLITVCLPHDLLGFFLYLRMQNLRDSMFCKSELIF